MGSIAIEVELNKMALPLKSAREVTESRRDLPIRLNGSLRMDDVLRARIVYDDEKKSGWGKPVAVVASIGTSECGDDTRPRTDEREPISSHAYIGTRVVTFSPVDRALRAPPDSQGGDTLDNQGAAKLTAGVDLRLRLAGTARPDVRTRQLWLVARTSYGAGYLGEVPTAEDFAETVRDASTVDADVSLEWEVATLQDGAMSVYLFGLYGISWLANFRVDPRFVDSAPNGTPDVAQRSMFVDTLGSYAHGGVGFRALGGSLAGTYFQAGWGYTDLLQANRNLVRLKVDTLVAFDPARRLRRSGWWFRIVPPLFFRFQSDTNPTDNWPNDIKTSFGIRLPIQSLAF